MSRPLDDTPHGIDPPPVIKHAQVIDRLDRLTRSLQPLADLPKILEHKSCSDVQILEHRVSTVEKEQSKMGEKLDEISDKLSSVLQSNATQKWVLGFVIPAIVGLLGSLISAAVQRIGIH
jgi:hypothetical protein